MPSNPTLNLAALVAPIPGDRPTGVDLRADPDSVYYRLRELRQECRNDDRQVDLGMVDEDTAAAKWRELARGCEAALCEQTKDLEIACWLVEAQARVRHDGASEFASLRDGFRLADALCTRYWDTLHSVRDEDDFDPTARIWPVHRLSGTLSWSSEAEGVLLGPIRKIALTPRQPPGPFSYWQIVERREKGDIVAVYEALRPVNFDFYATLMDEIDGASTAVAVLNQTLVDRLGSFVASTWETRDALHKCREVVTRICWP